jgi:TonB family protein
MTVRIIILLIFIGIGNFAAADSKGFCPPTPSKTAAGTPKASAQQTSPLPDAEYAGSVLMMAVISDKGYVCDAQVIRGLGRETDKKAIATVRQWHFEPARKDKRAVPVVITLEVDYWRKDGELIQFPNTPPAQTQNQPAH